MLWISMGAWSSTSAMCEKNSRSRSNEWKKGVKTPGNIDFISSNSYALHE